MHEVLNPTAGMSSPDFLSHSILASIFAVFTKRCLLSWPPTGIHNTRASQGGLVPHAQLRFHGLTRRTARACKGLGGHFRYGPLPATLPTTLFIPCAVIGAVGATISACTALAVSTLRRKVFTKRLRKVAAPLMIALIGMFIPQTLLWGETSLQCVLDRQKTPLQSLK